MNISRSSVVRFSSSALLAAVVLFGAHSFVPAAYGCSQPGSSDCKTSTGKTTPPSTVDAADESGSYLTQIGTILSVLNVLFP